MWSELSGEDFAPIDLQFGRLLERLDGGCQAVRVAATYASRALREGHSCLDLRALAATGDTGESWLQTLRTSPLVGAPGDWKPLILDADDRLYLYRYWAYEQRVAEAVLARARPADGVDERRLAAQLRDLFGPAEPERVNWQKVAAATAVLRQFAVISGGPGTGKTYTVVRILALLVGQNPQRPPAIALAAPTGKAAARMQEAIRFAKQSLPVDDATRAAIPEQAGTLHRLLGVRPNSTRFRHDRDNPLPVDVLVVDEASMVDLALMAKLMDALPPRARLILLGDRDQLSSVEAGSVLGDICAGEAGYSAPFAERLAALSGERVPAAPGPVPAVADAIVYLRESRRFRGDGGIGRLAQLINDGRAGEALGLLQSDDPELSWRSLTGPALARELPAAVVHGYRAYLEAMAEGVDAERVFASFNAFRVLCAHRTGPAGVDTLNQQIEAALAAARLISPRGPWYAGRPVMITENDYNLRLFNGDIGLVLPDTEGLRVCFPQVDGSIRRLHPARLPAHETVYAMTVHKTQGSEFERVLLVLPDEDSRVLNRKLLYTGVTRAKVQVAIWGRDSVFRRGVQTDAQRGSGLAARLWRA